MKQSEGLYQPEFITNQKEDNSINNFLPTFLVNELTKGEVSKENVLLYEDKDEEPLEIRMEPYIYYNNNYPPCTQFDSSYNNNLNYSYSNKNRWNSDKTIRKYISNENLPYYPSDLQSHIHQKFQNNMLNQRNLIENFNVGYNNTYNMPNNLCNPKITKETFNNNPHSMPYQYQKRIHLRKNNNFSNNPPFNNVINNPNDVYQDKQQNNMYLLNYKNQDYCNGLENIDKLDSPQSISTNISMLEENMNHLSFYNHHPIPKKMNSESNVNLGVRRKELSSCKSLFKEKQEETTPIINENESSQLNELIHKKNYDLAELIKSQKGSRIMQKELNVISHQTLDKLIEILSTKLCSIMNDTYGNYFSQKLIQCCTSQQRLRILQAISKDLVSISLNPAGTHSIQSLIEIINLKEEEEVIKEAVKNDILKLAYDSNSTHVLQKAILLIDEQNREHINNILLQNLHKLVLDSNGICVIKKLINGNKDINIRRSILKTIETNCLDIIQNPFGNYIIQHIIDEWGYNVCKDVVKIIHQNILSLSMQKFSSNVVEKCLDVIDQVTFNLYKRTREIWVKDIFNFSKLSSLLKNKYGNFVLQKVIQVISPKEKSDIKEYLNKKMENLSNKEKPRIKGLMDLLA